MESRWKAWTPATTREKAQRVARPLLEKLGGDTASLQIEPYPKTNGHVVYFTVRIEAGTWAEAVLAALRKAQSVGHGWSFGGSLDHELHTSTDHVSLTGISMLTCWLKRTGAPSSDPITSAEEDLIRELDVHDQLVAGCARGEMSWAEFETAYDNFYPRYPLDGHESDAAGLHLFEKHANRIALHREVWDQVLTDNTVSSEEAVRRVSALARAHRKL